MSASNPAVLVVDGFERFEEGGKRASELVRAVRVEGVGDRKAMMVTS